LDIPTGIVAGSSIRLPGVVDHVAAATPGDVIFIVRQRGHETFTRKGHDLAMEVTLSLSEALCGFQRQIVHLDGRKVNITGPMRASVYNDSASAPEVIQTGDVHVLKGEGMPKPGGKSFVDGGDIYDVDDDDIEEKCQRFGDLYVQYTIKMPDAKQANMNKLSIEERRTLGRLLEKLQGNQPKESEQNSSTAPRILHRAKASDFGRASGIARRQNENDEHMHTENDEEMGGQGFQYFSSMNGGRSQFFSRGSSPFTRSSSSSFGVDDDSDVQCQQM
jgi:DnaJ-class molecular chaperone